MNSKKITLSFVALTLSLALLQFSLAPLAIAGSPHSQTIAPTQIYGGTILSQSTGTPSNEPSYEGFFDITDIEYLENGQLKGMMDYGFTLNGVSTLGTIYSVDITGTYKYAKHGLMIEFSGESIMGVFSGQLKQDQRFSLIPGSLIGFINTPGNAYLSQVFVAGCAEANIDCINALLSQG